jgi:quercetin 2,3-dioxygenase
VLPRPLRIALPAARQFTEPGFAHHADLPVVAAGGDGARITVVAGPCRFFVIGGVPLGERLIMWWNFVARSAAEIVTARDAWTNGTFGEVRGYAGEPLAAPPLPPGELKPR